MLNPTVSSRLHLRLLVFLMALKNFDGSCAKRQNPSAEFCFRWSRLDASPVRSYKLPFYFDGLVFPVEVGPFQFQEFHLSHACRHGQVIERYMKHATELHFLLVEDVHV